MPWGWLSSEAAEAWNECDRIWRSVGAPVPCDHPEYLAARKKLTAAIEKTKPRELMRGGPSEWTSVS